MEKRRTLPSPPAEGVGSVGPRERMANDGKTRLHVTQLTAENEGCSFLRRGRQASTIILPSLGLILSPTEYSKGCSQKIAIIARAFEVSRPAK